LRRLLSTITLAFRKTWTYLSFKGFCPEADRRHPDKVHGEGEALHRHGALLETSQSVALDCERAKDNWEAVGFSKLFHHNPEDYIDW
jgi:hypothetical protein